MEQINQIQETPSQVDIMPDAWEQREHNIMALMDDYEEYLTSKSNEEIQSLLDKGVLVHGQTQ